jgi:hypothetical protein
MGSCLRELKLPKNGKSMRSDGDHLRTCRGRPLIVSNSRLVDQLRNFHRFLQLCKFLVAAPERDAEITATARTLTREAPRLVP